MNTFLTHPPPWASALDLVVIIALFTLSFLLRNQVQGRQMGDACGVQLVCKYMWAKEREQERGAVSADVSQSVGKLCFLV